MDFLPRELRQPAAKPSTADIVTAELAQVAAGGQACGYSCVCHGGYTCVRLAPHADAPHVGYLDDGPSFVQWPTGACLTPEQIAEAEQTAAQEREAATRALFAAIDPALLTQLLRDAGAL